MPFKDDVNAIHGTGHCVHLYKSNSICWVMVYKPPLFEEGEDGTVNKDGDFPYCEPGRSYIEVLQTTRDHFKSKLDDRLLKHLKEVVWEKYDKLML